MAGWEEGAQWMVSVMNLTTNSSSDVPAEGAEAEAEAEEGVEFDGRDIEVEIEDAEGGVARMTIAGGGGKDSNSRASDQNPNAGSN